MTPEQHHGERGLRDQLERYRTAFTSVIALIVLALLIGGYILANERLSLPGWFPALGKSYFTLKADFTTAQAITPGQGQAVTIAGAKVGEIASVEQHGGDALITMNITPKYAHYIYRNATMLLRPKTQLKDMTVEVDPGTPSAGRAPSGYMVPLPQTAPDVNFEEFLAALDAETRVYLQELLAGAAGGLKNNSANLSATFKRFDPLARIGREIVSQLHLRHENIERSIHNFQLIINALGNKDGELSQLIESSNTVFKTFAEQDASLQKTLHLLPGALSKTKTGLGKLATASATVGPTLRALEPFAKSLAPAQEASRPFFEQTAPIFKNEIRPFAREVVPVINKLEPSLKELGEAFPKLQTGFSVFNELFNEIAYNPGTNQAGFLFFLLWGSHDFNSVLSTADAHGPFGRTVVYSNCQLLTLLEPAASVNQTVALLVALFHPPTAQECQALGLAPGAASAAGGAKTASVHHGSSGFTLGSLSADHNAFARLVGASGGAR